MQTTTAEHAPAMALCSVLDRGLIIAATATKLDPRRCLTASLHACLAAQTLMPYQVLDPAERRYCGMGASLIGDALHRYALRQRRLGGNRSTAERCEALRDAISAGAIVFVPAWPHQPESAPAETTHAEASA